MKISDNCIELVSSFEGLYLNAYKCPAGVWTIGYGHTGKVDGKPIRSGMTITKAKAKELLHFDLLTFEKEVNRLVSVKLNQNQFDALVSFAFNCGANALATSTLLKKVNRKQFLAAGDEFLKWTRGGGRVLPGLERRRSAERALFIKPIKKKFTTYSQTKFIKELQKICKLKVTGKANQDLLNRLPVLSGVVNATHPVIKPLKKILKAKGYKISSTKAIWDDKLGSEVVKYKKSHNISNTTKRCANTFWKKIIGL